MADIKKLAGSRLEITISVPWEDWKGYIEKAVAEISQEIKVPGFRPGKAPRNLIEPKVGAGVILNNAAEKAVQKTYVDLVVREKIAVVGSPEVKIEKIDEGQPLEYKATVSVMPAVELDGKYKEKVKKINQEYAKKELVVGEDEIKLELEKLANSRVKLVTVRREARKEDSVEIDFTVLMDGKPIENGSSQNHPLILGRGVFIPGFEDKVIGMKEGEEKEFELPFPEDYHKKELAGKPAVFKVKLNLVQERQVPEVDDDFAKSLGKFENLEELKKNLKEGMENELKYKIKEERRGKYVDEMIASTKADLPEILIHEEIHRMLHEFEDQIRTMGMNLDQYLEKLKKSREELEKDWEPQAKKRVLSALALEKAAQEDEIAVDSAEVEAEMNKTLQYYKNIKDFEKNIDMEKLFSYSKRMLENEKMFEMLEKLI